MSRESRQRRRTEAAMAAHRRMRRKRLRWSWVLALLIATTGAFVVWRELSKPKPTSDMGSMPNETTFKPPATYAELCGLNSNSLAHCDIALMNLLCAEGLRGAEDLNISNCLAVLDQMAEHVKFETDRHYYKFFQNKAEFNNSEGYYRMMMLATVLQQDWRVHYDPDRIPKFWQPIESNDEFFANSQDVFIHGLARPNGTGTCSSMPVFYIAVGRRLGYPLKLVKAKGHLFARWVNGSEVFNIEGTTVGFASYDDDHYRLWPMPFSAEEERAEGYLKPLTPSQELSVFLSIRGMVLDAAREPKLALGAYTQALYKDSNSQINQMLFARAERRAFNAGVLPMPHSLEFELNDLEIPPGPSQPLLLQEKERLQAMLRLGAVADVESGLLILRAQVQSRQRPRSPLEPPETMPGQNVPLQR